jgi:hypothetical protein
MRGEIMRGFDVIDNWDVETKETDKDRFGEPFHYPNTFLLLLGYAKAFFHLSYTQTKKGIAHGHVRGKVPSIYPGLQHNQHKDKQVGYKNRRRQI